VRHASLSIVVIISRDRLAPSPIQRLFDVPVNGLVWVFVQGVLEARIYGWLPGWQPAFVVVLKILSDVLLLSLQCHGDGDMAFRILLRPQILCN